MRDLGAMEKGKGPRSRGAFRPGFAEDYALFEYRRRGESRVPIAPAVVRKSARVDHEATGSSGFPAQRFTAYLALTPVRPCSVAMVALRMAAHHDPVGRTHLHKT